MEIMHCGVAGKRHTNLDILSLKKEAKLSAVQSLASWGCPYNVVATVDAANLQPVLRRRACLVPISFLVVICSAHSSRVSFFSWVRSE